jgi:hypothetical protein
VMEDRVRRADCQHPVDRVRSSHAEERTNGSSALEALDSVPSVP